MKSITEIKSRVRALAATLGAKICENSRTDIEVEAPDGYCWSCEGGWGLHVLVASQWDDEPIGHLWRDLWERMDYGIEKCDCDECGKEA